MEFFQTIWIALTTENQMLINILNIPLAFIEATVSMLLFTTILNISTNIRQKVLYVLLLSIISNTINLIIPVPINIVLSILVVPLLIITIFKTKLLKALVAEIIPYIFLVIIELFLSKPFLNINNITIEQFQVIPIYKLTFVLLGYSILFVIYLIIRNSNIRLTDLNMINKKDRTFLLLNFSLGLFVVWLQTYLTNYYNENLPLFVGLINFLTILSYFFVSFYGLTRTSKLQQASENLETLQLYNKTLSILHDNIRAFRHDFNNIIQAIGGYITTNDTSGLKQYYYQLQEDCQKTNNLSALNPASINNPAIYSILASKYHKADSLGIKVNLEIFLDLNKLNMKIYEFTRILGILLDNAIEATSECKDKIINVYIRNDFNIKRQLLIIENTYNNKNVDIERIFEKGYSTKDKNTGLGLWEVRQILKKNSNLNLFTSNDNKLFKQQLEIY